jgi:hypothetical protein
MWDVIWEMRFRFVSCRDCLNDSFLWSCLIISSSVFSDRLASFLADDACLFSIIKWRMSVLDYQVTYVCSRSVERRLWWDVELDETSHQSETTHQTWRKRLIKLDEKGRHLIKVDEDVISSNLRSSSHQTFEKRDSSLLSDEPSHAATHDVKNLVLQKIIFVLCEDRYLCEMLLW